MTVDKFDETSKHTNTADKFGIFGQTLLKHPTSG